MPVSNRGPHVDVNGGYRGELQLTSSGSPSKYSNIQFSCKGSTITVRKDDKDEIQSTEDATIQRVGATDFSIETAEGKYLRFHCATEHASRMWVQTLIAERAKISSPTNSRDPLDEAFEQSYASESSKIASRSRSASPERPAGWNSSLGTQPARRSPPKQRRAGSERDERVSRLAAVFALFDLDNSGQIESNELYAIGTARRALGQKQGVWNEESNQELIKQLDRDGDGMVSQTEFCTHFETALPTDVGGFGEAITQFTAAAMLVQERKKSGNLRAKLEAKERSAATMHRQPSPPTRKMMEAKVSAEATIREAKEKAAARLAAENAKNSRKENAVISPSGEAGQAWRQQQLAAVYRLLVDGMGGLEPIPVQNVLGLRERHPDANQSMVKAFTRFSQGPSGNTVSSGEFVRHFSIMLPREKDKFNSIIEGFKLQVTSAVASAPDSDSLPFQILTPSPSPVSTSLSSAAYPKPASAHTAVEMQSDTAQVLQSSPSSRSIVHMLFSSSQFLMLAVCLFMAHFFCSGMVPMLPVFARGIGITEFHFGCLAAMQPLAHALTYLHGQRVPTSARVSSSLLMLCAAAALLALAEKEILALYSARLLQGFGFAGMLSCAVTIRVSMELEVQKVATRVLTAAFMLGGITGAPLCGLMHSAYGDHRAFAFLGFFFGVLFLLNGLPAAEAIQYDIIPDSSLQRSQRQNLPCNPRVVATILVMLAANATLAGFESTYAYFMEEVQDVHSVEVVGLAYGALLFGIYSGGLMLGLMPSHELLTIAGLLAMALGMECSPVTAEVFVGNMSSQPYAAWSSHLGTMFLLGLGFRAANSAAMGALEMAPEGNCEHIEMSPLYRLQQTWIVASIAVGAFVGPVVKHGMNFAATAHMGGLLLALVAIVTWFPLALTPKPTDTPEGIKEQV